MNSQFEKTADLFEANFHTSQFEPLRWLLVQGPMDGFRSISMEMHSTKDRLITTRLDQHNF